MSNIREEIRLLQLLGPLPSEDEATQEQLQKYDDLERAIARPVTDDEARILVKLFGSDDCFGLSSSFVHLIETAPNWPIEECLTDLDNEWILELKNRAIRGGVGLTRKLQ